MSDDVLCLLSYDPSSGLFTWKTNQGKARIGATAGTKMKNGYLVIGVGTKRYLAHRLAWRFMAGEWPPHHIDHVNGVRTDNRWSNIRSVKQQDNNLNSKTRSDNKSGYRGVCWNRQRQMYRARINFRGKEHHLGFFHSAEEAHKAYEEAADRLFGKYKRAA